MTVNPAEINSQSTLRVRTGFSTNLQEGDQFVLRDVSAGSFTPSDGNCALADSPFGVTITDCVFTTDSVTVTLGVSAVANVLTFEFAGFNNPPSAGVPTATLVHLNPQGIQQSQVEALLTNLIPQTLQAASVTALDDNIAAEGVEVEFSLTLSNQLPSNGQVRVTLPYWNPESVRKVHHFITSSPRCEGLENVRASVSCQYSTGTMNLILTGLDAVVAGSTLRFKVSSFRNPYDGKEKGGFEIASLDSEGSAIDSLSGLTIQVGTPTTFTSLQLQPQTSTVDTVSVYKLRYVMQLPIDSQCRMKVTAPSSQFTFTDDFSTVRGNDLFSSAPATANLNAATNTITVDGCSKFYESGENFDELQIVSVRNVNSVRTSLPFTVGYYSVQGGVEYLTATDSVRAVVNASSLTEGSIGSFIVQGQGNPIVQELTNVIIEFTPAHSLPASNKVEIRFPSDDPDFVLADQTSCSILSPRQNTIANPSLCKIESNLVTIEDIFGNGSTLAGGSKLILTLSGLNNPISEKDVGAFSFQTYEIYDGTAYPIDNGSSAGLYAAQKGTITSGLSVQSSSYTTYDSGVTYTITFNPIHKVPRNGKIVVTVPLDDIGITSVSAVQSQSYATSADRSRYRVSGVSVNSGAGIITFTDVFSQNEYDPSTLGDPTVTLEIGGLRNPVSLRQSQSFIIETQDSEGYAIDYVDQGMTITMTEVGELNSINVETSSEINGEPSTFTFTVNTATPLESGDYFEIGFPADVDPPTAPSCSSVSNLNSISCTLSGRSLRAQLTFRNGELSGGQSFAFELADTVNPRSTEPSDPFTPIRVTDPDLYGKSKYTPEDVTVKTSQPWTIEVGQLTQTNNEAGKLAEYTLTYTTANPVPAGGSFLISYPENTGFTTSAKMCKMGMNGSIYRLNCAVNTGGRTIKLTNLVVAIPEKTQVQLTLGDFTNPLRKFGGSSLIISSFADAVGLYAIDKVTGGMVPGVQCDLPCAACVGPTEPSTCTLCYTDGTTDEPFLYEAQCLDQCPTGWYGDRNSKCQDCYNHCRTCSDFSTCTSCDENGSYPYFYDNSCLIDCPKGTYPDSNNQCQPCQSPCLECTGPNNGQCLSCQQVLGQTAIFLDGNNCVSSCPVGTVSQNYQCKPCSSGCQTCEVNMNSCTSCKRGTFLLGTQCTAQCPSGYLSNKQTQQCEGCDPKCAKCSGDATNQACLECQEPLVLYNNTCFTDCPDGYVKDNETEKFCVKKQLPPPPEPVPVKNETIPVPVKPTSNSCSDMGESFALGFLVYFPMILLACVIFMIGIGSWCYEKKTKLTATLVAFLAPVETIALIIQVRLAYKTEGLVGKKCWDDSKGEETTFYPVVFWVTLLVIILLYILNTSFLISFLRSPKLKEDERFQVWRAKYCKWTLTSVLALSEIVSFKVSSMLYSNYLGRKRYLAKFSKQKSFFKITQKLTIWWSLLGQVPIVLVDLIALGLYSWGSQFYIAIIETLCISLFMVILQMIDFKHGRDLLKREAKIKQLQPLSQPPGAQAMDDDFGEVDDSVRLPLKKEVRAVETPVSKTRRGETSPRLVSDQGSVPPLSKGTDEALQEHGIDDGSNIMVDNSSNNMFKEIVPDAWAGGSQLSEHPLEPSERCFNENDILGEFDRDKKTKEIMLLGDPTNENGWRDKLGRKVSVRGYLLDKCGNVINQNGKKVLGIDDLYKADDEVPLYFDLERFNFNPFDILGNLDMTTISPTKPSPRGQIQPSPTKKPVWSPRVKEAPPLKIDLNRRNVNKFGFLIDEKREGHIVNRRMRKMLDRVYLQKNGDFPFLLNFDGIEFHIRDVCGDLLRDCNTGDAVLKQDAGSKRFYDRQGREINKRGYLVDRRGNVITTKGRTLFRKEALSKDGEIPKIFTFTKFNVKKVLGEFARDEFGKPALYETKYGPNILKDATGNFVNRLGFLIDLDGNIIDKKGIIVFRKEILINGNIPRVYRKVHGLITFDDDAPQDFTEDVARIIQEMEPDQQDSETPEGDSEQTPVPSDYENSQSPGNTSMNSQMEATPADYNMANQRFFETDRGNSVMEREQKSKEETKTSPPQDDSRLAINRPDPQILQQIASSEGSKLEDLRLVQSQANINTDSGGLIVNPMTINEQPDPHKSAVGVQNKNADLYVHQQKSPRKSPRKAPSRIPSNPTAQPVQFNSDNTVPVLNESSGPIRSPAEELKVGPPEQEQSSDPVVSDFVAITSVIDPPRTQEQPNVEDPGWQAGLTEAIKKDAETSMSKARLHTAQKTEGILPNLDKTEMNGMRHSIQTESIEAWRQKTDSELGNTHMGTFQDPNQETEDSEEEDPDLKELREAFAGPSSSTRKKKVKKGKKGKNGPSPKRKRFNQMEWKISNNFSESFHSGAQPQKANLPKQIAGAGHHNIRSAPQDPKFMTGSSFNPIGAKRKALQMKKQAIKRASMADVPKGKLDPATAEYLSGKNQTMVNQSNNDSQFEEMKERHERRERHRKKPRNKPSGLQTVEVFSNNDEQRMHERDPSSHRSQSIEVDLPAFKKLRPLNNGRLKRIEQQYLQRLPVRTERKPPRIPAPHMNQTSYSGASGFNSAFARHGPMTTKHSTRTAAVFRDTWNQVYTEPQIVAENTQTKWMVNQQLKEHYTKNNDIKHLKELNREEKYENSQSPRFWGPAEAWATLQQSEDNQEMIAKREAKKWRQIIQGKSPSSRNLKSLGIDDGQKHTPRNASQQSSPHRDDSATRQSQCSHSKCLSNRASQLFKP